MISRWQELEPKVVKEEIIQTMLKESSIRPSQFFNDYLERLNDHAYMEEKYLQQLIQYDLLKWDADSTVEQVNEAMKEIGTKLNTITDKSGLSEEEAKKVKAMEYVPTWLRLVEKRPAVTYWSYYMIHKQVRVIKRND